MFEGYCFTSGLRMLCFGCPDGCMGHFVGFWTRMGAHVGALSSGHGNGRWWGLKRLVWVVIERRRVWPRPCLLFCLFLAFYACKFFQIVIIWYICKRKRIFRKQKGTVMTKVIHVHLIHGRKNYYFGSISAIYTVLTEDEVGIKKSSLLHAGLADGGVILNKKAMIRQGELIRGVRTEKEKE